MPEEQTSSSDGGAVRMVANQEEEAGAMPPVQPNSEPSAVAAGVESTEYWGHLCPVMPPDNGPDDNLHLTDSSCFDEMGEPQLLDMALALPLQQEDDSISFQDSILSSQPGGDGGQTTRPSESSSNNNHLDMNDNLRPPMAGAALTDSSCLDEMGEPQLLDMALALSLQEEDKSISFQDSILSSQPGDDGGRTTKPSESSSNNNNLDMNDNLRPPMAGAALTDSSCLDEMGEPQLLDMALAFSLQQEDKSISFQDNILMSQPGDDGDPTMRPSTSSSNNNHLDMNDNLRPPMAGAALTDSSCLDEMEEPQLLNMALALSLQQEDNYISFQDSTLSSQPGGDGGLLTRPSKSSSYNNHLDMDTALALALQAEEDGAPFLGMEAEGIDDQKPAALEHDKALALALQHEKDTAVSGAANEVAAMDEMLAIVQVHQESEAAMQSTPSGKAWRFVSKVFEKHSKMKGLAGIEPVDADDMLFMVERAAEAHAVFGLEDKPTHIDIGYHYTRSENLQRIKTNGLLSHAERNEKGVSSQFNGSVWGDGVYTANDPYSHSSYGDIGLLVARLKGDSADAKRRGIGFKGDTAIAMRGTPREMVILSNSYQCIPLAQFQRSTIRSEDAVIWDYHSGLQEIVDDTFNEGKPTKVKIVSRPSSDYHCCPQNASFQPQVAPSFPAVTPGTMWRQSKRRPVFHKHDPPQRVLNGSPLKSELYCYTAPATLPPREKQEPLAKISSGTMRVSFYSKEILACDNRPAIVIVYSIFSRIQQSNHGSSGNVNCSKQCLSFLPDTAESRKLLGRLKAAFCSGLTFAIDCERITPDGKAVAKEMIPRKTSPYHGFPDPDFMVECHKVVDQLGVPPT